MDEEKEKSGGQITNKLKEQGKKQVEQQKKNLKKKILHAVLPHLVTILIVLMLASAVYAIFSGVVELIKGIGQSIVNLFTVGENGIVIEDENIDQIIEAIESSGIDLEDLELLGDIDYTAQNLQEEIQEAKRKYIRMFLEAQIVTQEIRRGNSGLQGQVYLYPESAMDLPQGQKSTLTYLPYEAEEGEDSFKQRLQNNDQNIQQYFSINNGQLILATLETTTVDTSTRRTDGNSTSHSTTNLKTTEIPIDYKNLISQYSTPISFFLSLGMTTRNPEFLAEVAELVIKNTRIELTVLNTTTTEVTRTVDTATVTVTAEDGSETEEKITTTTRKEVVTVVPSVRVTFVDTWICTQEIKYNKMPSQSIQDPISNGSITTDAYDAGVASEYIDNTDSFINLLDKEYKIPNSNTRRSAGAYLRTDAELFFDLLQQNPETQGMEQVMRYIMYKYTGRDYGVTSLDFSIFDPDYFSDFTGGIYGNSAEEKVWFSLKGMGLSEYAIAGVMGNIYGESGFNPNAIEGGSGEGIGLCQWSFGRRDALEAYAESKGTRWSDVDTQIQFLMGELTIGRRS